MQDIDELYVLKEKEVIGSFPLAVSANLEDKSLRSILAEHGNEGAAEMIRNLQFPRSRMGSIVRYFLGDTNIPMVRLEDRKGNPVYEVTGVNFWAYQTSLCEITPETVKKLREYFRLDKTGTGLGYVHSDRKVETDGFTITNSEGGLSARGYFAEATPSCEFKYEATFGERKWGYGFKINLYHPMDIELKLHIYLGASSTWMNSAELIVKYPDPITKASEEATCKLGSTGPLESFEALRYTYTSEKDDLIAYYTTGDGKNLTLRKDKYTPPNIVQDLKEVATYQAVFQKLESLANSHLELTKEGTRVNIDFAKTLDNISRNCLVTEDKSD